MPDAQTAKHADTIWHGACDNPNQGGPAMADPRLTTKAGRYATPHAIHALQREEEIDGEDVIDSILFA